jgi:hypothetical protein
MPHGATAAVRPGRDTVDAIVLTLRIPDDDIDDGDDGGGGRGGGRKRRRRRNVNVIHSSGVHGVEGYLGSAVQVRFLHELLLRSGTDDAVDDRRSPSASSPYSSSTCFTRGNVRKVLLIHSVNPYGMRHHRRTNENNVDLNRNVLGGPASFAELRSRHPNECHYVDMDAALNPADRGDVGGGIVPPFSWADAALGGGYAGDVSGLRRHDEEMMARRRRPRRRSRRGRSFGIRQFRRLLVLLRRRRRVDSQFIIFAIFVFKKRGEDYLRINFFRTGQIHQQGMNRKLTREPVPSQTSVMIIVIIR